MSRFNPRFARHWASTALCSVIALHATGVLAADITVTPPAGGGFVIKGSGGQERMRVQGTGEVYVPGLSSTGTSSNLTCYDSATGQLTKCQPGLGNGATGATGADGGDGAAPPGRTSDGSGDRNPTALAWTGAAPVAPALLVAALLVLIGSRLRRRS